MNFATHITTLLFLLGMSLFSCARNDSSTLSLQNTLAPNVNLPSQQAPFTPRDEVERWVVSIRECLAQGQWKCVERYAQHLMELDDSSSRAFGGWALGLSSLEKGQAGVAYRYFGLAVRDNPYRVQFQKWFALASLKMGRLDLSRRHTDWLLKVDESSKDQNVHQLVVYQDWIGADAPRAPAQATPTVPPTAMTVVVNDPLNKLWDRTLKETLSAHCFQYKKKPEFCP